MYVDVPMGHGMTSDRGHCGPPGCTRPELWRTGDDTEKTYVVKELEGHRRLLFETTRDSALKASGEIRC